MADWLVSAYYPERPGVAAQLIDEGEKPTLLASRIWAERIRTEYAETGVHVEIHRGNQDNSDLFEWWRRRRNGAWEHGCRGNEKPRATCPSCGGNYRKKRDGTMGKHAVMISPQSYGGPCPGRGQKPKQAA